MLVNIQKKIQQIIKELGEKDFKLLKVEENYCKEIRKERFIKLLREYENLQKSETEN